MAYNPRIFGFPHPWASSWAMENVETLRETIPDSVVTVFLLDFGTPVAPGPARGPEGLVACLLRLACLLDAQAPPQWSNSLINRLRYYVLQLGDHNRNPNPNDCGGTACDL